MPQRERFTVQIHRHSTNGLQIAKERQVQGGHDATRRKAKRGAAGRLELCLQQMLAAPPAQQPRNPAANTKSKKKRPATAPLAKKKSTQKKYPGNTQKRKRLKTPWTLAGFTYQGDDDVISLSEPYLGTVLWPFDKLQRCAERWPTGTIVVVQCTRLSVLLSVRRTHGRPTALSVYRRKCQDAVPLLCIHQTCKPHVHTTSLSAVGPKKKDAHKTIVL